MWNFRGNGRLYSKRREVFLLKRMRRSKIVIIIGGPKEVSTGESLSFGDDGGLRYFRFDTNEMPLYKELCKNGDDIAVGVSDIKELIYACNIGVKYAITNKEDAAIMQKIVDSYMFDTKLLAIVYGEDEIEWAAVSEIDGIVFDEEEEL